MNTIIIRPVITEKSMQDANASKFTFAVNKFATKSQIKKAVALQFKVNVTGVATRIVKGKTKHFGNRRREIALSPWKKAIITLKKGEKIALFDIGGEKQ